MKSQMVLSIDLVIFTTNIEIWVADPKATPRQISCLNIQKFHSQLKVVLKKPDMLGKLISTMFV